MANINNMEQLQNAETEVKPYYRKVIGKTTYLVSVHFKEDAKETLEDKIKRMIREDAQKMDAS